MINILLLENINNHNIKRTGIGIMYTPFNLITRLKIIKDALKIKIEKAITNILQERK